ncbi:MAG: hypothetical protein GC134_02690 [Proteobacteria bacterium]|nr:hypothetical protein [Pseudomonadota bacterium]
MTTLHILRGIVCGLMAGCVLWQPASAVAAVEEGLLRTVEIKSSDLSGLPKWQAVVARLPDERKLFSACLTSIAACPDKSYAAWREVMKSIEGQNLADKLRRLNRYVNSWPYRTDLETWGAEDYWAAPSMFLKKSGDDEDFAIMKYLSLSLSGIPVERMRLVVARDVLRNTTHTVLAVYENGDVYIMDNIIDAVLPQASVLQYAPLYSVNEKDRWVHILRTKRPSFVPTSKVNQ